MKINHQVVIISDKESVVIRGIKKHLGEEGYEIWMSPMDETGVKKNLGHAALYIIYLSADILGNKKELANLVSVVSLLQGCKRTMIVIGEKKFHEDMLKEVPALGAYPWMDRPLNVDDLLETIEKVEETVDIGEEAEAVLAELQEMDAPGVQAQSERKRILIVDDDPAYASMVREWIRDYYKVDIVTAGMQAITFLMKNGADMILLDYEMPVVDGPQVLEMLRSEPRVADIPVIFLTGVGDMESVKRVMALRPRGYVLKSTTRDDLIKYLNEHM